MIWPLLLLPLTTRAQTPSETEPAAGQEQKEPASTPLYKGSEAPFDGILLSPQKAKNLWKKIEICEKSADAADTKCKALVDAEVVRCDDKQSALESRNDSFRKDLKQCQLDAVRKWYESPFLWGGTGCVTGGIVSAAALVGIIWLTGQVFSL